MIIPSIIKRRSVRQYSDKPVSDEQINEIIKAAQFAPTAVNNRSVEFIVVRDASAREKLFELSSSQYKQDFVKKAPVVIVPVINNDKSPCPVQDLSLACAHIFLQATELGIGTVWKNIVTAEEQNIKEFLGIPDNFQLICLIPVGYPTKDPPTHADKEFSGAKVHQERW